jgi:hypothetical protein
LLLIPSVVKSLSRPPLSIARSACDDPEPGATIQLGHGKVGKLSINRPFDRDVTARMLRVNEGRWDPEATWKGLSRAERKRAKLLWDWTGEPHGLSVPQQGRPPLIDAALVLYCTRVLCEAAGQKQFKFSRSITGAPTGPMWRALIEALPLAQRFLTLRYGGYGMFTIGRISTKRAERRKIDPGAEAIAEIITVARSKPFEKLHRERLPWQMWPPASDEIDL